ncbi:unnamed protein product [Paramecium pentaurelia]|uniref:G domain-containing protein n=1 Tax=Paramecium pentaurelia TaxID=43138 RepID=A0A8S1T9I3_9CILI|nr:unnamed protein product [Paramecium pentaurelia]
MKAEKKKFIVKGQTGAGKSFFLNLLEGKQGDNGSFQVAQKPESCTKNIQTQSIKLFGNGMEVILVDTPGFYDSEEKKRQNNNEKPETFQMIENLSKEIKYKLDGKINKIFQCISVQDKLDAQKENIINIVKMFVAATIRIVIIITKFNTTLKSQQQNFKTSWKESMNKNNFEDIIFVGDELQDEEKNKLVILLKNQLLIKSINMRSQQNNNKTKLKKSQNMKAVSH